MTLDTPSRPLFFAALAFTLFMALSPAPPHIFLDTLGDKAEHGMAFAALAFLARVGFRRLPEWVLLERLAILGAGIEFVQAIPALHRDCDWHDLIADLAGAVAGLALARAIGLSRKPAHHD